MVSSRVTEVYQVTRVALVKQSATVSVPAGSHRSDIIEAASPCWEVFEETELLTVIGEQMVKQTGHFG